MADNDRSARRRLADERARDAVRAKRRRLLVVVLGAVAAAAVVVAAVVLVLGRRRARTRSPNTTGRSRPRPGSRTAPSRWPSRA
ncbi:hypothetical protein BJF79_41700 [Actinomadura sp. CNU-125]|uniref:hypothetical protein n=1 Tax=Actinomadura sp. CNU-125 TaxID=1904961 RepID=UPI000963C0EB|nr:hypothetical protein [Actinomadura sp. CNU-125]OLT28425.1 hypothetical protein BJF79_41700 [Actinomadura sp. CNU-125]